MSKSNNASGELTRVREGYEVKKDLLIYDHGKYIFAKDCADAWRKINSFMLQAGQLKLYRISNRHCVPRVTVLIEKWENLIPLSEFGYNRPILRLDRLERNYLDEESLTKCRNYMETRKYDNPATHGISFGTGRKKTPACMVGGTFTWVPGRLLTDFYLRASEVTKTLGADFHFLDRVIKGDKEREKEGAVPEWMSKYTESVRLHLNMAFMLSQFFPLFDMISPGYPIMPYEYRFHRMCWDAIQLTKDENYVSKWRAEARMHRDWRKRVKKYKTDRQGRILSGPSFFPKPSSDMP